MRRQLEITVILFGIAAALAQPASGAQRARPGAGHDGTEAAAVTVAGPDDLIRGRSVAPAKATRDTIVVYGGQGTLEGKFELADGNPDRQGWVGQDFTVVDEIYWHTSTFHAAHLDPDTPDNHAWWCGTVYEPCEPDDNPEGYGDGWEQLLAWTGPVTEPSQPVTVRVTARVAIDTEPGYDYLFLEVVTPDGSRPILILDSYHELLMVDETFVVAPAEFSDPAGEVTLRWRVSTDGGWSDVDCLFPSDYGAAQIDKIVVTFDQGDGPVQIGPEETAEPGAPSTWQAGVLPGVGDYSQVWPDLEEIDPCSVERSPHLAFIDDGVVVPGTGGSPCITWCYGPGGYVVNSTGGLRGDGAILHNVAWSPPIPLPGDPSTGALLEFDVFTHNGTVVANSADIFWIWSVRSTADPTGATGWSAPRDRNFVYEGGPGWLRWREEVGDLLEPGARWVQVALGVRQYFFIFGNESTPAPYFDNVRLTLHAPDGPQLAQSTRFLAQDAFPTSGALDPGDLGAASVRFDCAIDVDASAPVITAGDSLILSVQRSAPDAVLDPPPQMHYRLFPNPLFDTYRSAGQPTEGVVAGDSVGTSSLGTTFAFDLPDEGFVFPGDVVHYFFTATERRGAEVTSAIIPADTAGFGRVRPYAAPLGPAYDVRYVFRALPGLRSTDPADRPAVLFWDRSESRLERQAWQLSLAQIGMQEGVDYDLFATRNPSGIEANGLAYTGTIDLLAPYDLILFTNGNQVVAFGGPFYQWGAPNPAPDTGLLEAWLNLGDRALAFAGDRLVESLSAADSDFLQTWLGAQDALPNRFPDYLDGQHSPPVVALPDAPWPLGVDGWIASGCAGNRGNAGARVPAVLPYGPNAARLAGYATPDHDPDPYPYAAALVNVEPTSGSRVVTVAHALLRVESDRYHGAPGAPLPARALLLGGILAGLGQAGSSPPVGAPDAPAALALAARPNPFNPAVMITYGVPRADQVRLVIHDLRGRRVRCLVDERLAAGPHAVRWDGRDDQGRQAGSGVYFAVLESGRETRIAKLTLVK
ncbi:MAG TPA: FlgD immunoglobulin-like domain containing protein [Candidatus Krumholzibacteria bacterium]|nr:FlgD immunoglobulin-like domain containing protein [Candidatus Krumholzibacteria bacterium]HPD70588.1 FlgD immunoglobulin-like domain containing protein [Candidatus Krumholzibacteria bacterium]HRY39712.1 FlgD immunoglobulin-like domain containing protein [Candidatus Krumholzibacteria bacterium]